MSIHFRFILSAIVFISVSASSVFAGVSQVDVVGYGQTHKAAIADALVQAVRQSQGVSVDALETMSMDSVRATLSDQNNDSVTAEIYVSSGSDLGLATKGAISTYSVNAIEPQGDGSFQADLSVEFAHYDKPGLSADGRRSIAVMPFNMSNKVFTLLGDRTAASRVESEFRARLLDYFTQSRRLNVVDRQYVEEFHSEKALWSDADAASSEFARLGNVLGADYLVVGQLRSISSKKNVEVIQLTGEKITSYSGVARLDYKIILSATRQVKWSDSISLKFSDRDIRKMLAVHGSSQTGIVDVLASELSKEALSNIYPLRIVAVKGKTVVINQGGKGIKKGERLDVYMVGEELFDPYTNESLGQMEEKIARIEVTKVNSKMTYARVLNGDEELVEKGYILRR